MAFIDILAAVGIYLWSSFKLWVHTIFVAPSQNFQMLWILIPIYLGWIFADFFQEKKGTDLGNAISNGVIPIWAGIDWTRQTVAAIAVSNAAKASAQLPWTAFASRFAVAAFVLFYGIWIIWEGVLGRQLTKYIGRIREVTYFVIMFTPVIYGVTPITFQLIFCVILFFPVFYYFVEFLDYLIPDPKSIQENSAAASGNGSSGLESNSGGDDPFGSSSSEMSMPSSSNDPLGGSGGDLGGMGKDPFS